MAWIVTHLWLVPALPILAAGVSALAKRRHRTLAASVAIGAMFLSFLLSLCAFAHVLSLANHDAVTRQVSNHPWFQFGDQWLMLGWVLDPLTALMLLMVTFVGLLIFIYSVGYMAHDENFTRFFCFLALFAGAMLGVVISNSLLLLFMCWELVGLTSYLLIGFWYSNPNAAAAAKKAFIVTRIGDLGFLLGMVWLYSRSGTLLFYDGGGGFLEHAAIARLLALGVSTGIALLIFCGAAGKSGQVPLHVWLPDAMEGPTPVSALIHAATMVAAGVFLIARIFPLMSAQTGSLNLHSTTTALQVVTWVGATTAIFGAIIAVAQYDIKRILAYSTISQLGYMMMGLGVGGVAVGMFHLLTHAFFKALLFLGAGSVIHGCNGEQDIRKMGGLRKLMPITFATYAVGMLALCGFPLLFSGFWSKDEILHSAHLWTVSQLPFYLGVLGALLTAFYMTRQVYYVFAGSSRLETSIDAAHGVPQSAHAIDQSHAAGPHESSLVMTVPLMILAVFSILLGFLGTPAWRWLQSFLEDERVTFRFDEFLSPGLLPVMVTSTVVVLAGIGVGWWFYGRERIVSADAPDALGRLQPGMFAVLGHALYFDEIYSATIVRLNSGLAAGSDWFDRWVWNGAVQTVSQSALMFAWLDDFLDAHLVNPAFDEGCRNVSRGGQLLALFQGGRVQTYLRMIGGALIVLAVFLLWGASR
jgi:NADH-quinone oxidoreductase subunit L